MVRLFAIGKTQQKLGHEMVNDFLPQLLSTILQVALLHIHKDPLQIYSRKKIITPRNITIRFYLAFSVALHVISD